MKRLFSIFFATMLAGQAWAQKNFDFSAECNSGQILYFKITSDTTVAVTYPQNRQYSSEIYYDGYIEPSGDVSIPETITNNETTYSVTSISDAAFKCCENITSIIIPNSIKSIGHLAFYDSGLTSVTIGNGITSIGYESFRGCYNLTSITIPESVTSIGNYAFECNNLKTIIIPHSVSSIGYDAFYYCKNIDTLIYNTDAIGAAFSKKTSLKTVIIGDSVTSISNEAFRDCSSLTSINIPNSVKSIGNKAFFRCYGLTKVEYASISGLCGINFYSEDSNPLYYAHHLYVNGEEITDLVIPDSITTIGYSAFAGCKFLKSVTIPESVTKIGGYAFYNCTGLSLVKIPESVTNIGENAFLDVNIIVYSGNATGSPWRANKKYAALDENGFLYSDVEKQHLASYIGEENNITIPNSVISIDDGAFRGCSRLTSVSIPNTVTTIGSEAFYGCSGLTSITIPNSVTSIGNSAFYGCNGLSSITIPITVINIGFSAFNNHNLIIYCEVSSKPDGWAEDYNYDWGGWRYWNDNIGTIIWGSIGSLTTDDFVYNILSDTAKHQIVIQKYTDSANSVEIPSKITSNGIEYTVVGIGDGAFKNRSNLASITIPNTITQIGSGAFDGCDKLDYNIYDNGCYIGNDENPYLVLLMAKRQNITECVINSNCKFIYDKAFNDCSSLSSIVIPAAVTSIGIYAFSGCTSLIKAEFTSIESLCNINMDSDKNGYDFYGNKGNYSSNPLCNAHHLYIGGKEITDLVIPKSITNIGNGTFAGCNELKRVVFHESVSSISESAFLGCSKLSSVTIPNSVESVGNYAFSMCEGLTTVIIPKSVKTIGKDAFNNSNITFYCETESKPNNWYNRTEGDMAHYYYCYWNANKGTIIWNIKTKLSDDYVYNVVSDSEPRQVGIYKYLGNGDVTIPASETLDGVEYQIVAINNSAFAYNSNGYNNAGNYLKLKRIVCISETPIKLEDDPFPQNDTVYVPANSVEAYRNAFVWKRKEILPIALYEITAKVNTEGCSVIGMGSFANGATATLTATPAEGYHFVKWSDGNTENPRTITVSGNLELMAIFVKDGEEIEESGTSVAESAANAINIYAHGNAIVVENATDEISVYDAMGRLVCRDNEKLARTELQINGTGVYIVKVGNVAKRVMVN